MPVICDACEKFICACDDDDTRTPATVEREVRDRMAEHAAIPARGFDSGRRRASLRDAIDRGLDEHAMRRAVEKVST